MSSIPANSQQVIVKFHDHLKLPYEDNVADHIRRFDLGPWNQLTAEFPGISISRMYKSVSPDGIEELVERARRMNPEYRPYNFLTVFLVECPVELDAQSLARGLSSWPTVERAYVSPRIVDAGINDGPNQIAFLQTYLLPAPDGIDAHYAWTKPGGDGEGQTGADIEGGWMLSHEDLVGQNLQLLAGAGATNEGHGTGVLGIVCADDNSIGCVGIVPHVELIMLFSGVTSFKSPIPMADMIMSAVSHLKEGHVLLLEVQTWFEQEENSFLPVEAFPESFNAIALATSLGITVIEPSGNGGASLDLYKDEKFGLGFFLNRKSSDFKDSGALMVGAGSAATPHARMGFSNHGTRVDSYARGELIVTCASYDPADPDAVKYAINFNGTSGASAIIAGAALSTQGIAQKNGGRLSPFVLRQLFSNPLFGTPSAKPDEDLIGVMPNLRAIADALMAGPTVILKTPTVEFVEIAQGFTSWNAATFEVNSIKEINLELIGLPLPPFGITIFGPSVKVFPTGGKPVKAVMWFSFTAAIGNLEPPPPQTVTVVCKETGQQFQVTLTATVTNIPYLGTMLVLDKSGSMGEPAGASGFTRIQALRQAAASFVSLVPPDNELGIVSFATATQKEKDIAPFAIDGANSDEMLEFLSSFAFDAKGDTAIGKGVQLASDLLDQAKLSEKFTFKKSIVVFTDGRENVPPFVNKMIDSIKHHTYAIGLGNAQQVSVEALTKLTEAVGGYCLLTGELTPDTEGYFRLVKYFIQVLVDLTSQQVTTDPHGTILPGQEIRIPWKVTEADFKCEVVLLTDMPVVGLAIETPHGQLIEFAAEGVVFGTGPNLSYCRMSLPLITSQGAAFEGTWHAVLRVDPMLYKRYFEEGATAFTRPSVLRGHGARYSLSVHTTSNLKLNAQLNQGNFLPGENLNLHLALTEYGVPVAARANASATIYRPDNTSTTIHLEESEPGIFQAPFSSTMPGVYRAHIVASGRSFSGQQFTREKLLTGAVLSGGERQPQNVDGLDSCCRQLRPWFWVLLVWLIFVGLLLLVLLVRKW